MIEVEIDDVNSDFHIHRLCDIERIPTENYVLDEIFINLLIF